MAFFCSSDVDRLRFLLEREDADGGSARMVIFATLETRWEKVRRRKGWCALSERTPSRSTRREFDLVESMEDNELVVVGQRNRAISKDLGRC
jgi:hypothetical protein